MRTRRVLLAASVAATIPAMLAASPAWAKTGVVLHAPVQVTPFGSYQLTATGGDDAGSPVRICIDQRVQRHNRATWVPVRCATTASGFGSVSLTRVAGRAGNRVVFRGAVYSTTDGRLMSASPARTITSASIPALRA